MHLQYIFQIYIVTLQFLIKFYVAIEAPMMMDVMLLWIYIPPYVQALEILCLDSGIILCPGPGNILCPGSEIILSLDTRNILCLGSGNNMFSAALQQ